MVVQQAIKKRVPFELHFEASTANSNNMIDVYSILKKNDCQWYIGESKKKLAKGLKTVSFIWTF